MNYIKSKYQEYYNNKQQRNEEKKKRREEKKKQREKEMEEQRNQQILKEYFENKFILESALINYSGNFVEFPSNFKWLYVGSGLEEKELHYKKFENLPLDFIEKYEDFIQWSHIGTGHHTTSIEDLPFDLLVKYQNKLNWRHVGSGYSNRSYDCFYLDYKYTVARNLPNNFILEFKDKNKFLFTEYLLRFSPKKELKKATDKILPDELQNEIADYANFI